MYNILASVFIHVPAVKWSRCLLPATFCPLSFARLQLLAVNCPQYFDRCQMTRSNLTAGILTAVI
jgi:hypothetical protein